MSNRVIPDTSHASLSDMALTSLLTVLLQPWLSFYPPNTLNSFKLPSFESAIPSTQNFLSADFLWLPFSPHLSLSSNATTLEWLSLATVAKFSSSIPSSTFHYVPSPSLTIFKALTLCDKCCFVFTICCVSLLPVMNVSKKKGALSKRKSSSQWAAELYWCYKGGQATTEIGQTIWYPLMIEQSTNT